MNVSEVLSLYGKGTRYERVHGIKNSQWKLLEDFGDIKFYGSRKSDGTVTLLLIFQAGKSGNWCGWMPNEKQASILTKIFPKIYDDINDYNSHARLFEEAAP